MGLMENSGQTKATKDCVCISLRKVIHSYCLLVQFTNELRMKNIYSMLSSAWYSFLVALCF